MFERVLAIDGGGTKTDATLRDSAGTVLATARAGPSNLATDPHAAIAAVDHVWRQCCATAGFDPAQAAPTTTLSAALAGISSASGRQRLQTHSPFGQTLLSSDAYAALIGAFGDAPGALLIAGTGAIACRLGSRGVTRIGGWGFPAGDRGGGAWIGLQLVSAYLDRLDLQDPTPTDAPLAARLGNSRAAITAWLRAATPAHFASLAPLAPVPLLDEATNHLATLARVIGTTPRLALTGGLAPRLASRLEAVLGHPIERPTDPALEGAFLIGIARAKPESF